MLWWDKLWATKVWNFPEFKKAIENGKNIKVPKSAVICVSQNIIVPKSIKIFCDGNIVTYPGITVAIDSGDTLC